MLLAGRVADREVQERAAGERRFGGGLRGDRVGFEAQLAPRVGVGRRGGVPRGGRQAYDRARVYAIGNDGPARGKGRAGTVACLLLALVRRFPLRRPVAWVLSGLEGRRTQGVIGALVVTGATALMVLGFLRPWLFGADYFQYNGTRIRSYDEQILHRLSWFFTPPGFALMLVGVALVGLRRWVSVAWAIALPTLMLFAVYAYTAKNSTRMLWWTRRYVPTVLPGVLMLISLALAVAFVYRFRGRAVLRVPSVLALGCDGSDLSGQLGGEFSSSWRCALEMSLILQPDLSLWV